MKKKIKILLISIFSLLLIVNTFSSCEAEKDFTSNNKLVVKRCSMKDINLQGNTKLIEARSKLKNIQEKSLQRNLVSKLVYDENSGLLYDDEKGIYVSKDGKESYNFPVIQEDNEKVINITFNKNKQNEYDVYLVKYDFTKEDVKNFSKEILAQRDQEYFSLLKDGIAYNEHARWMICVEKITVTYVADGTYVTEDGLDYDVYCPVITVSNECYSGGPIGPQYTYISGDGSGPGGGSTGGGGGVSGPSGPPSAPSHNPNNPENDPILSAAVVDGDGLHPKFPCVTPSKLLEIFPGSSLQTRIKLAAAIQTYASKFGIDTKLKLCHFLAQIKTESAGLTATMEGLTYTTVEGLRKNFWDFKLSNPNSIDPTPYLNNPEGLANFVYCCNKNGNGNGDVASGDGWTYRGRGYIQLTGKYNYSKYYDYLTSIGKSNLYLTPEDVANDPNRILSAMWFFKTKVLNKIDIDENTNADKITKKINKNVDKNSYTIRRGFFEDIKNKINC